MEPPEALDALMAQLAPGMSALAGQVRRAVDDPVDYLRIHARRLRDRGVEAPVPRLAQLAVLDALAEKKLLAEVDGKLAAEDVLLAVGKLTAVSRRRARWKALEQRDDLDELDTATTLALASAAVADQGLVLAALDLASDSYPVVAIPAAQVAVLATLAVSAGFRTLRVFDGSGGAKEEAEVRRVQATLASEAARIEASVIVQNPVWRPFVAEDGRCLVVKVATLSIATEEGVVGRARVPAEHRYATWEETSAAASAMIAERTSAGFVELPLAEFQARNRAAKQQEPG